MSNQSVLILSILIPLIGGVGILLLRHAPNLREACTLVSSIVLAFVVYSLLPRILSGETVNIMFREILPGLPLEFNVEPLGMLFACIASGLWIINSLFSFGYMRGNREENQTRFYIYFTIAISSSMGIAFAGNMFTLFIFYEILTLSTYPLVAHKQTSDARSGARIYLGLLIGTSVGFQLVAIIWTYLISGTLDFTPAGILRDKIDPTLLPILLALYMFGIGKAALMPFHRWLPSAMVAPTPVSALLHAVAVVKAGVFTVLKVVIYIFGIEFLSETGASTWLIWVASFTLLAASIVAITKDNLKALLAYSTISQLSYIVLGAALVNSLGILGGGLHIATHAIGKITLFMCAGAIYVATHKTEISDMTGLGRKMPFTYAAFTIGSLSIIGLPPLAGTWSKWYLALAAADTQTWLVIGVYMLSSLLNVWYLLSIVAKGFFAPSFEISDPSPGTIKEAPLLCVLPPCLTALGCIALFFFAERIVDLLRPIVN